MEDDGGTSPLDEVFAARVQAELGVEPGVASSHWRELDRFLQSYAETGIACSPPRRIDEVWHALVEHEGVDYSRYCTARFGYHVHHHEQSEPVEEGFPTLRAHAEARFGPLDPAIWDTSGGLGKCIPMLWGEDRAGAGPSARQLAEA